MRRVVLDLNVMLRGLLNPHSLCGALLRDYSDRYRAIFSAETLVMLNVLLIHPTLVEAFPRLAHVSQRQLKSILLFAERVSLPQDHGLDTFAADIVVADISVATARAARADYLITESLGILPACQNQGIPTLNTRDFLALLDSQSASPLSEPPFHNK